MSDRTPLYPRLLRLRNVHPNGWQRAALGEGALAVAGVLVLADLATAWTLLVLPVVVALVVKGHDVVAGALAGDTGRPGRAPLGGSATQPDRAGADVSGAGPRAAEAASPP